jgi:hypothetical protein
VSELSTPVQRNCHMQLSRFAKAAKFLSRDLNQCRMISSNYNQQEITPASGAKSLPADLVFKQF